MLAFFKKLQSQEFRYGYTDVDPFAQSHPLSGQRVAPLTHTLQISPAWDAPTDPALEEAFERVKAQPEGYVADPRQTPSAHPHSDDSIHGHYAPAYAHSQSGYPEQTQAEITPKIPHE